MLEIPRGTLFGGRYSVMDCLGAGGMGAVYLATDPRYRDFKVALKVLYPGIIKTPEARERFKTEIIASYRIPHRNVIRAYEYFDEENIQAYTMEYVSGGDLQKLMLLGDLSLEDSVQILRQAAAGLHAIHEQGILHRDLKPENILLTHHKCVKIGDFGVARMREATSGVTQIGAMVGTPKYFAPEYIETGETDHRGDIYALGVIAYELISGVSPFRSDTSISLMIERIRRPQEPICKIAPHCPRALGYIIEKAMAVSVAERYQSAEEMFEDLREFQAGKSLLHARDFVESLVLESKAEEIRSNVAIEKVREVKAVRVKNQERRYNWFPYLLAASLLCFCIMAGGYAYLLRSNDAISNIPDGAYRGFVSGFTDDGEPIELKIWKEATGSVLAHLEMPGCKPDLLSALRTFECKDTYNLNVISSNEYSLLGTIKNLRTERSGSFSASRIAISPKAEN